MNKFHSTKNSHSIEKLLAAFSDKLNDFIIVIISHIFHLMEMDLHLYTEISQAKYFIKPERDS